MKSNLIPTVDFETAVEAFILNHGIELPDDTQSKTRALFADPDLAIELVNDLVKVIQALESELVSRQDRLSDLKDLLSQHFHKDSD